ncbi:efflux RND transporter periplasmic adaptor subunit [Rhizobium sp. SL86]|uniref:efflux RND transporter periplasmic adaptor subunit n=1 Tax=Rhizobium sp. SL86 TaxID=2995148 RepID=UPI00227605F2|nr:efflux RND transporter periplasmic adaptor subunit [Rhizobium sp. SL86]MCY1665988.1 efflux RND transporter periplasmic adaptor subunit [Rhizobium sp. SL86]
MSVTGFAHWKNLALGLALIGLAGCSQEKAEAPEVVRPVKVVEVTKPDEGRVLQYSGSIRARTEIAMGFRVDGKVTQRLVDVGQRVKPGDVLARLDPIDYELSVRQAEAQLASAEKQVEISRLALNRVQILQEKSITSQSTLEQSQLAYDQAVSSRDAAKSALEQAENRVAYTVLTSDVDGIVTATSAEAGQVVAAGSPVVTVAQDGAKEVAIAVPETDIGEFRAGKTVNAGFWSHANLALEGKVREIAGSADSQSRTFAVRISLPDDPNVLLGMTASVSVKTDDAQPAFVLPLAALSRQGDQAVVWLVDRQTETVKQRPVTVAGFAGDGVRVTQGIAAGDLVVAAGTQFMREDMKVRLYEAGVRSAQEPVAPASLTQS